VQSTNPDFNNAVVRINVFREHRQTIQYIDPQDSARLAQAELLVVDEAAAVPLPWLRRLFGPYLVFLATTTGGYEGTGRALELKLLKELRASAATAAAAAAATAAAGASAAATATTSASSGRSLQEVVLETPIRYAPDDPIERWLNELLCLDTRAVVRVAPTYFPPIEQCQLYSVNRDTLMSYHAASEQFLQSLVALFVASHYRNTPNDLLMLADAPAHHIFVLLGPLPDDDGGGATATALPAILCAVHVCMEGAIAADIVRAQQARGQASSGDLIPWTLAQHFQDSAVAGLSGARIVRIATHPSCVKKGYGTRALELLRQHFQRASGAAADDDSGGVEPVPVSALERDDDELATLRESLAPRKTLPPLLTPLEQLPARRLDWIGTSFGLTPELYRFWRRNGYTALYVRQTPSEVTGEHSCIMLRAFDERADWLALFSTDFRERLLALFGYAFSALPLPLATALLMDRATGSAQSDDAADADDGDADDGDDNDDNDNGADERRRRATGNEWSRMLDVMFSRFDVKRLDSYARNLLDYNEILDLVPELARCYFRGAFRPMELTPTQAVVLLGIGLQHKSLEQVALELSFPRVQAVAQFNKLARRVAAVFGERAERAEALPTAPAASIADEAPRSVLSLDAELAGGKLGARAQVRKQRDARAKLEAEQTFNARAIDDAQAAELADLEREGVNLATVSLRSARVNNNDDGIVYERVRAKKSKQPSKRGKRK
jgi:N-acetyltransferase 10